MEAYTAIEKHVNDIVERLAVSKQEQEDMKFEFLTHLQASKTDYEKEGYSEKEAEELAISHFGKSEKVADDMHEAVFPHRKLLLLIMAVLSLLTTFGIYLTALFSEGDAHYAALVTTVLSSTCFLILSEAKHPRWEKKAYLVPLLIIHGLFFIYQSLIASSIVNVNFLQVSLSILTYTIILFTIALIFQVALTGSNQKGGLKTVHIINIIIGLVLTSFGLFVLWVALIFGGIEGLGVVAFVAGVPFTIWVIAYVMQVKLLKHNKIVASYILLALLSLLVASGAIFYIKMVMVP